MAYGDFKDLPKETFANTKLRDKEFNIAENLKCDAYHQCEFAPTLCF